MNKKKIDRICFLLEREYGIPEKWICNNAVDALIGTILSQNTNDKNRDKAHAELRKEYGKDYEKILSEDSRVLARVIHSGGLANIKAERIKQTLKAIKEHARKRRGEQNKKSANKRNARESKEFDLSFLRDAGVKQAKEFMRSLPGVGPKTSAVVLHFCFGKPVFPIDTHVFRILKRIGLIGEKTSYEKAHELMDEAVPHEKMSSLHLNLITHGRRICSAGKPKCEECVLRELCEFGRKSLKAKNA